MDSIFAKVPGGNLAMSFIFYPSPTPTFPVLPPLGWSVHKKTIMASRTTTAATGRETQLACAVYPRWEFLLTYGGNSWLREETQNIVPDSTLAGFTELEQLSSLFLICRGAYGEFFYDDPDDDSRTNLTIGTTDGVSRDYPVYYDWGNGPFSPSLLIPVGGINTLDAVYLNGVLQSPLTYIIDSTRTKISFTGVLPPSAGQTLSLSFHFYFRCRFSDDNMKYEQFVRNLWEVKEVRFESVKP